MDAKFLDIFCKKYIFKLFVCFFSSFALKYAKKNFFLIFAPSSACLYRDLIKLNYKVNKGCKFVRKLSDPAQVGGIKRFSGFTNGSDNINRPEERVPKAEASSVSPLL